MGWIYLIAAIAMAANRKHAANKRDEEAAAAIMRQQRIGEEANQEVSSRLNDLSQRSTADEQAAAKSDYTQAVKNTLAKKQRGFSDAYDQRASRASQEVNQRIGKLSSLMSRVDAVQDESRQEGYQTADSFSKVRRVAKAARGQQFVDKLKVQSIQPNPWIDLIAQAGMAYAMFNAAPKKPPKTPGG